MLIFASLSEVWSKLEPDKSLFPDMRDNMTNNIEETKPSNKKLWFILAGVSITVIGITLAFFGLPSSMPNTQSDNPSIAKTDTPATSAINPPTIETVETSADAKELSFSIKVKDVDTSKWSIEYEVADQDRVVRDSGKTRQAEFDASAKVSSSTYYRIRVRAANDEGKKTEWSENYTVKLAELKGMKTVEPATAYYETGWAKGTDSSMTGAKTAIETAWNITELKLENAVDMCLPINSGEMTPKLLLPPIPSVLPNQVTLKYMTNDWNGSAISITYLWCQ
jgi:hypothetical protein